MARVGVWAGGELDRRRDGNFESCAESERVESVQVRVCGATMRVACGVCSVMSDVRADGRGDREICKSTLSLTQTALIRYRRRP